MFAASVPFLEQRYPRLEGSNLLSLYTAVSLSLHPTRAGAPSSAPSFGLSGFEWPNDKLGQGVGRKFDLQFDLLGAPGTRKVSVSNRREDLENTFVDDLNHRLQFLAIESLDGLGDPPSVRKPTHRRHKGRWTKKW